MSTAHDMDVTKGFPGNSTGSPPFEFTDYAQRVVVATVLLITSVVGIIGNSLVILAVLLSKKLRSITIAFMVNLSVADLLTALVIPWDAVALLGTNGLPVGEWVCSVVAVTVFTTVGCSIYTLASIGVNRLLLITRPRTTYRLIYTPKKVAVWLLVTWLFPLLVNLGPLLVDVGAVGFNMRYHYCGSRFTHPRYGAYNLIRVVALYPVPLLTILVCYTLIWGHLYRHAKRFADTPEEPQNSGVNIAVVSKTSKEGSSNSGQQKSPERRSGTLAQMSSRQKEITRNMLYVVCGFVLCMTPYTVSLFFPNGPAIPYTTAILFFNSCINPLIYATKHRDFRTVFSCILRRQWESVPDPSDTLKAIRRAKCCGASNQSA